MAFKNRDFVRRISAVTSSTSLPIRSLWRADSHSQMNVDSLRFMPRFKLIWAQQSWQVKGERWAPSGLSNRGRGGWSVQQAWHFSLSAWQVVEPTLCRRSLLKSPATFSFLFSFFDLWRIDCDGHTPGCGVTLSAQSVHLQGYQSLIPHTDFPSRRWWTRLPDCKSARPLNLWTPDVNEVGARREQRKERCCWERWIIQPGPPSSDNTSTTTALRASVPDSRRVKISSWGQRLAPSGGVSWPSSYIRKYIYTYTWKGENDMKGIFFATKLWSSVALWGNRPNALTRLKTCVV